jgi:hypothetical protein
VLVRCCGLLIVIVACGRAATAPSHDELFRRLLASTIELPTAGCDVASPLGEALDAVVTGLQATGPTTATTACRAQRSGWRCRLVLETRREPTCDRVPTHERCGVTRLTYTYEVDIDAAWRIAPASVRCTAGQR